MTKMALRDLVRRRRTSLQSVACLSAIMTLITLAVVGGVIANETTQSYVERAIGQNIILVAQDEMVEQYRNHLEKFFGKDQTEQVNYLDWKYVIPSRLISDLNVIDGVVKVDPRLVLESALYELPNVSPNPEDPEHYIVIGGHRFGRALIIGVHAEKIVNEWLILGERLNESDLDGGLIGDSLALTLFQNPLKQSFIVQNNKFKVVGVCLDPLNNGMVVYVPVDRLSSLVNYAGYNVLLVKIDSSNYSKTLNEIEAQTSKLGLTILELNEALERQKAFVNYIWSMMLSLSLFSFVNAVLSLMGYLMLSITGQHRDLGIMWVLGAKPNTVVKVILFETFLLVLVSGAIGLPVGVIIAFWFFIPEAVISTTATLSIVGLLSVLMSALCLSSLYPARKVTKAPITKTIY